MAYGNEENHLEGSDTDTTLGDLQSMVVGSEQFISAFARYHQLLITRKFAPNFTIMTADKDDPRFDSFYLKGNEIRMFIGLFLTDMPSYMGLGFEQRDTHPTPAPNEHYTKLYVFQLSEGEKATQEKYHWGQNGELFGHITALKIISDEIGKSIENQDIKWLIEPDMNGIGKVITWTQKNNPQYVFVVNLDTNQDILEERLNHIDLIKTAKLYYSNQYELSLESKNATTLPINFLKKSECRIYKL